MKTRTKKISGRRSIYSSELEQEFFALLMCGETLSSICKREDMPDILTVYDWSDSSSPRYKHTFSEKLHNAILKAGSVHSDLVLDTIKQAIENPLRDGKGGFDRGWVELIKKKSDAHARQAGMMNRKYNQRLALEAVEQEIDIEI